MLRFVVVKDDQGYGMWQVESLEPEELLQDWVRQRNPHCKIVSRVEIPDKPGRPGFETTYNCLRALDEMVADYTIRPSIIIEDLMADAFECGLNCGRAEKA